MAAAGGEVSEHAVHHAPLHGEVYDGFVVAVVNAGEFGLFALFLDHLHLFDEFGGKVAGSQLRVVQEEGLAVDGDFLDGLPVGGDGAVFGHLDARELFQKVYQHIVVRDLEGRGVVLHRVLLDDDGVSHGAHGGGLQHFQVLLHLHHAQAHVGLHLQLLHIGLVTHQFGLEGVGSRTHFLQGDLAVTAGEGVLGLPLGGGDGDGGKAHGFAGGGVLELKGKGVILSAQADKKQQAGGHGQQLSNHILMCK